MEQRQRATLASIHPLRQVNGMASYYRSQYPHKQNAACVKLVSSQTPEEWEEDELLQGVMPQHSHAPQHRQTNFCSEASESPSAAIAGAAILLQDSATDCQSNSEALPSLLERPQHAQHASSSPAAPAAPVVDERLIAAAPTHARTVMLQQQQELAGFSSHAQLPMPFSHLLCLWAIKLVLPHPVTQIILKVTIPDPPVFEQVRAAEARLVSGSSDG